MEKRHAQMYLLKKRLKKFEFKGETAVKEELSQMYHCTCFRYLEVTELTCPEKKQAIEGLMFLTEKRSGEVKGRLAYNGKPKRELIRRDEKNSYSPNQKYNIYSSY